MHKLTVSYLATNFCFAILFIIALVTGAFGQEIHIAAVDTVGSVGSGALLKLNHEGNPHILYYDWTNNRIKSAVLQDSIWNIDNSFIIGALDDFEVDSLGNIHAVSAGSRVLKYCFSGDDTSFIATIDSGYFSTYTDGQLELIDGTIHILTMQYLTTLLIEAKSINELWELDTLCTLPTYPSGLKFKNYGDENHASYAGTQDHILIYTKWTGDWLVSDTVFQDSVYRTTDMDIDSEGNPWIAFDIDHGNGYTSMIAHKIESGWQLSEFDTSYHSNSSQIAFSYVENTPYALFLTAGNSNRHLILAHRVNDNWIYNELFSGPIVDHVMAIDTSGNIHIAFSLHHPNDYDLYYTFFNTSTGVKDNLEELPVVYSLSAYPNPFNSATTITLTDAEQAEIGIYDITGRLITTLHTVGGQALWDASAYSSGLYFARLAGEKAETIKLVLVK
jgi:hypothetical protein